MRETKERKLKEERNGKVTLVGQLHVMKKEEDDERSHPALPSKQVLVYWILPPKQKAGSEVETQTSSFLSSFAHQPIT